ncbi:uncharacterized protein TNCV_2122681 [Trichonephila clavipes]|nr:uncharacterized protein TNCV_2122681 [Trichonephila clavipes]
MHVKSVEPQCPYVGMVRKRVHRCISRINDTGPQHVTATYGTRATNSTTAAVAEWYRYRIVAGIVTSSSPVPLKTRRVGQRCTLNLSRAETSSRGVVVRRGGASSVFVHAT